MLCVLYLTEFSGLIVLQDLLLFSLCTFMIHMNSFWVYVAPCLRFARSAESKTSGVHCFAVFSGDQDEV